MNLLSDDEVPIGFGMGLAQDTQALQKYASLNEKEKRDIIEGAKRVRSHDEMAAYISRLHG